MNINETSSVAPLSPNVTHLVSEAPAAAAATSANIYDYIIPESFNDLGQLKWGRLICTWHEKKDNQLVAHIYAACLDGMSGGIYLDCSPQKIFAKFVVHLFSRPLFTIAKTIYYLSLYPFFVEIANCYHSNTSREEKLKSIFRPLADIILTPLYGIILTVTTIAIIITAPFSTNAIYEGRRLLGQIEEMSNWGKKHTSDTLAICFQPTHVNNLQEYGTLVFDDTAYRENDPLDHQITNFGRRNIRRSIKYFDIFTCGTFSLNEMYASSVLSKLMPAADLTVQPA